MTKLKILYQFFYSKWLDVILLLLVAIVWGTSYGVAKHAVLYYPVLGFLALRFCITALVFLPSCFRLSADNNRASIKIGVPLGLVLLLIFISETYGLSITTASNSAFLISLYVVLTPFIQWLVLKERPQKTIIVAAFLSVIGAFLLSKNKDGSFNLNLGDYLIIAAAIMRAFMVTFTKKLTQNVPTNMIFLTSIQTGVVGLGCLMLSLLLNYNQLKVLPSSAVFWFDLIYLILFCTMFAFFVQNFSVKRTSPTKVSLLMGSEPVWGALYATMVIHESLSPISWLGGVLIVAASLWASIKH